MLSLVYTALALILGLRTLKLWVWWPKHSLICTQKLDLQAIQLREGVTVRSLFSALAAPET